MSQPPTDPARRSRLLAVKLAALVRDHAGEAAVEPGVWPGGAALVRDGVAWVLAEDAPGRALGPALAWARQQGTDQLHLLAEQDAGMLARRAASFAEPRPAVWRVEGRSLLPAEPAPYPEPLAVADELEQLAPLIVAAGAVVSREHGVLAGEVAGLEVCRAVLDPTTGVARLEVGVGAHDREAFQMIHGDVPALAALERIVVEVARHRLPAADPHPLNRLAAERRLRWFLADRPGLLGLRTLQAAPPPVPRPNLKDAVPCVAVGEDASGAPVVVVCSVGVDLDLVPFGADARRALGLDESRLILAVPSRDALAVTQALAARLARPAEVVAVDPIA